MALPTSPKPVPQEQPAYTVTIRNIISKSNETESGNNNPSTPLCQLELDVTPKSGESQLIKILLVKLKIDLETNIDGSKHTVYGLQLKPIEVGKNQFFSALEPTVQATRFVISEIFRIFSVGFSLAETDPALATLKTKLLEFNKLNLSFIVFSHYQLNRDIMIDIDQRQEITNVFTPNQEKSNVPKRGNLNLDTDMVSANKIALFYDTTLGGDEDKLRAAIISIYNTKPPESDKSSSDTLSSDETKTESRNIKSFKEWSNFPTLVETDNEWLDTSHIQESNETKSIEESVKKHVEELVRKNLESIKFTTDGETSSVTLDNTEYPLGDYVNWSSLKNETFKNVFSNDSYAMTISKKTVTVSPTTFTFTL